MYTYNGKKQTYRPQISVNKQDINQFKESVSNLSQSDLQALANIARQRGISEADIIEGIDFINKL